ncbi:MAG: DsbA family protein [Nitriliruptoraceae bacterium]
MSTDPDTVEAPAPGTTAPASGGSTPPARTGLRGLLAPLVALLVVGALALAALGGGQEGDGTAAPDAPPPSGAGDSGEDIADDLDVEPDPGAEEAREDEELAEEEVREQLASLAGRDPEDPRALGDADAPVVMVQWADFFCPFCGVFARDTEPELIERYVDTGLLRIEWRDLPFQGEEALLAAVGGQAAAQQDAFWAYHEAMFAADLRRGDDRFGRDYLLEVAADLDLDVEAFDAALDDDELRAAVQSDALVAETLGITGTPAFLVEGRPVVGAQPLEVFVNLVENAIVEAGAELP